MNFRLDAKNLFLTYPQCTLTRDNALQILEAKPWGTSSILGSLVAQETHADGSPHLHVLLLLSKRKNIQSNAWLDIGGFHGNYQACRDLRKVYDYCTKADSTPLDNIDPDLLKVSKKVTREQIGQEILDGAKLVSLVEKYPHLIFGFSKLQADVLALERAKAVCPNPPMFLPNPWGRVIKTQSHKKKRNWWIFSCVPNRGKTTWAKQLETEWEALVKGGDFTYWNIGGTEKIIILDEYNTAGLKFNALNQLCDGTYEARVFMGGLKRLRPYIVIVLSNVPIRNLYPNMYALLEARFIEYEIL